MAAKPLTPLPQSQINRKPEAGPARAKYFKRLDLTIVAALQGMAQNQDIGPDGITPQLVSKTLGLPLADTKWRLMMLCKWTGPAGPGVRDESRTDRLQVPSGINLHKLWADFESYSGIPAPVSEDAPEETTSEDQA